MSKLFGQCASNITTVEGMFANCSNFSADVTDFFEDMTNLTNAKYTFAHSGVSLDGTPEKLKNIFQHTRNLSTTCGMFLDCESVAVAVPYELFQPLKGRLTNTSYMFAGSGITEIGRGLVSTKTNQRIEFTIEGGSFAVPQFKDSDSTTTQIEVVSEEDNTYHIKTNQNYWTSTLNQDRVELVSDVSDATLFTLVDTGDGSDNKYIRYNETVEDITTQKFLSIVTDVKGIHLAFERSDTLATEFNFKDNYLNTNVSQLTLEGHGLLTDCLNLIDTSYMFAGCGSVIGQIPPDIFYSNRNSNTYNRLTSIAHMFDGCVKMYSTKDGYTYQNFNSIYSGNDSDISFIPSNWAIRCPNINSLEGLFQNVGSAAETKCELSVPMNVFSSCSNITTVAKLFYNNKIINKTRFNNTFLQNTRNKLISAANMLAFASVDTAGGETANTALFVGYNGAVNRVMKDLECALYKLSISSPCYLLPPARFPNVVFGNKYVAGSITPLDLVKNTEDEKDTLMVLEYNQQSSTSFDFIARDVKLDTYTPSYINLT